MKSLIFLVFASAVFNANASMQICEIQGDSKQQVVVSQSKSRGIDVVLSGEPLMGCKAKADETILCYTSDSQIRVDLEKELMVVDGRWSLRLDSCQKV